jgi:uncharacterized membrane protein (DUF106 family)
MATVNAVLARIVDLLLAPFRNQPPIVGLVLVSLVTAVAMLLVFKRTSNQRRLEEVKRKIHASLFEIRLFNDDFRAILRAQAEMLRHNATYLRLSLAPMVWVVVPLVLVVAQLQFYYGYAPMEPGQPALLKVEVRSGAGDAISIDAPAALRLETPAIWFPGAREVMWRVRPASEGPYDVRIASGNDVYDKSVQVGGGVVRRSPVRPERGIVNQVLYPSEPPVPADSAIASIWIDYREADVSVLGWRFNWMVWYLALSFVFAFALRKPLGVTI